MAKRLADKPILAKRLIAILVSLAIAAISIVPPMTIDAAALNERSIRVSNGQAAQSGVTYRVAFTTSGTTLTGSIRVQFCSNTSLVDELTCNAPAGFDISGASLVSQTGITGFLVSSNTTANEMVISRPPALAPATSVVYEFDGVTNPFSGGSMFARIYTHATSDGTGSYTDAGGIALYFERSLGVVAEVPPYLKFCVGENITGYECGTATEPFSDVGILSPLVTGLAQSQMVAATNAPDGYSMWVIGGTMTSGNNVIPEMTGSASQKGTSQFGINLRANTAPIIGEEPNGPGAATIAAGYSQQNTFRYQSGDTLATVNNPDDNLKYTVSYVVNVDANQPGGVYATTLTYIALANF